MPPWVCVCVCCFGHRNVTHMNYTLISYWLKKNILNAKNLTWISEGWNSSLSPGEYPSLHPLQCFLTNILLWNWLQTQDKQLRWGARCFWFDPFQEVSDFFLCVESLLADRWASNRTAGGYNAISVSKNTAVSFIWRILHQSIIKEWSFYFRKSFQRVKYNGPLA